MNLIFVALCTIIIGSAIMVWGALYNYLKDWRDYTVMAYGAFIVVIGIVMSGFVK